MKRDDLHSLLSVMSKPAFWIAGAGASVGLAPLTVDLRKRISSRYLDRGSFAPCSAQRTPLFDRVVLAPMRTKYGWADYLLSTIPASMLELLVQKELSVPLVSDGSPPQYWLLKQAAPESVFFSFNLDGLARFHLSSTHRVIEPHGTADRLWTESPNFDQAFEWSEDVTLPAVHRRLLPGPEPSSITSTIAYTQARPHLASARAVVILGYSFARFRGRRDDSESFEWFIENVGRSQCPILVVDPQPEPIVAAIEERLRSRRVYPVKLEWDKFSKTLSMLAQRISSSGSLAEIPFDDVQGAYQRILDLPKRSPYSSYFSNSN